MNTDSRKEEILRSFHSFQKETYHRDEALTELLKLQQELVDFIYGDSVENKGQMRIHQVVDALKEKNIRCGNCADRAISALEADAKNLSAAICTLISGNRGEAKAFSELENLRCSHSIMKNVELIRDGIRTEIDAVVVTPQGLFLIEVKNTRSNIEITKSGEYYVVGECLRYDKNIKERLTTKEDLLTAALNDAGIPKIKISKILVFTNNYIEVNNQCLDVDTIYSDLLCRAIEKAKPQTPISEDMALRIQDAIDRARSNESYPIKVDVQKLKDDFAYTVAILEDAENRANHSVELEQLHHPDYQENFGEADLKNPEDKKQKLQKKLLKWGAVGTSAAAVALSFAAGYWKMSRYYKGV